MSESDAVIEFTLPNMKLYLSMFLRFGCKNDQERLELVEVIKRECCMDCGKLGTVCQCWNDE